VTVRRAAARPHPARLDPAILAVTLAGACQQYVFLVLTTPTDRLAARASGLAADPARVSPAA
jgi:hypothetical protein